MTRVPQGQDDQTLDLRLQRQMRRAQAYAAAGDLRAAIASLEANLEVSPHHAPSLLALAKWHLQSERHNPARAAVLQACAGRLESPRIALDLVRLLNAVSESRVICDIAAQLPPECWDSPQSLAEFSQQLSLCNANDLALAFARAGVERDPTHPPSLYMQATCELLFGNLSRAADLVQRCLHYIPEDHGAHWLLSRLRQPDPLSRVTRIQQLLARTQSNEARAWLAYALHNEFHDAGDYDQAWAALEVGCRAKRALLQYDPSRDERLFSALLEWRKLDAALSGYADEALTPVFIVGLHRSGTTLAERILTGHSRVAAGGETYDIRAQLRRASGLHYRGELDLRVIELRSKLDYRAIGAGYIDGIRWRSQGLSFVTDKLPSNFLNIGFIAQALPAAKFIRLRRNPVEVGLSSLRTLFSDACGYSYDQMDFVSYYRNYEALLQHWQELFPGRILDVNYDELVANPEGVASQMATFCGLEFEPGMVRIEARTDAVSTASSVMMRDGIRRDRGEVWKRYGAHLTPLLNALGGALR